MMKIILVTLSLSGGNVTADNTEYFDTLEDCEIFAIMMQEDAIMRYRFGYEPTLYVCEIVEEREA